VHEVFFLLGKSVAETVLMLQETFKEEALNKAQVYEWYSCFTGGKMSCEEQPISGWPSTCWNDENLEKGSQHNQCRLSSDQWWDFWGNLFVLISSQWMLMEDLNTKRVSAKFVPWLLRQDQKHSRLNICYNLREQAANNPQILSKVVTGDETWC